MPLVALPGGLRLNVEDDLHADGRPALVLLHGFTGSLEDWDEVAPALRRRFRVVAVDLVGHGRSDAPDEPRFYGLPAQARQVAALLDATRVPRAVVCGYSMGARIAMHLALARPERVERLVLESASPGVEDPGEREKRLAEDAALVAVLRTLGIAAFVELWMQRPFLAASRARLGERAWEWQRQDRLKRDPRGLAHALEHAGQAAGEPLGPRLPSLATPTRFVVGEEDARYRDLAERMAAAMPTADVRIVPGAGHAPHREAPEGFLGAVPGKGETP